MVKSTHPSSSKVQREAEQELIQGMAKQLNVKLIKDHPLKGISSLEVDGYCKHPRIMCEAWAHIGSPKGAQYHKVMMDALKMLFIEKSLGGRTQFKKVLVFADEEARAPFHSSNKWQAKCLKSFSIKCNTVKLRPSTREKLKEAQKRQGSRNSRGK